MSALTDILGDNVINEKKENVATGQFAGEGKVVGLYFSAHWCPPCRAFTPELVTFYKKFKEGANGKNFEMVFVSSDRDEESFNEYFAEMPWHALPFSDRDRKNKLSKKFKVQGIPMLIFVDASNGNLITSNGREKVSTDPEGLEFPWHPKSITELLLTGTLKKGTEDVEAGPALEGAVKGLYFSAHWCPPCRIFTPELVKAYNQVKEDGKKFEVVFVSSDRTQESFDEYFATMPWLALPFGDKKVAQLKGHFSVEGIPTLVLIDENNELITGNGRQVVMKDPEAKEFPWPPKPLEPLEGSTASPINDTTALILFGAAEEGAEPETWVSFAKSVLEESATQYKADYKANNDLTEINFYYEIDEEEDIAESLRMFAQLGDVKPVLVLLDIPEQRVYISKETSITKETAKKVLADFKSGSLEFKPLRG